MGPQNSLSFDSEFQNIGLNQKRTVALAAVSLL